MQSYEKEPIQYCPRCGWTRIIVLNDRKDKCRYCDHKLRDTNELYYEIKDIVNNSNIDNRHEYVMIHYVYRSPEYRKRYKDQREQKEKEELEEAKRRSNAEFTAKFFAERNSVGLPKCPSCGSTNISKIGVGERALSVGMFGMLSGKIGKTHKCNNCGNMW